MGLVYKRSLIFGHTKSLQIEHRDAIVLDNRIAIEVMIKQPYDGRDLNMSPWNTSLYSIQICKI
jgi:hypothetical protein